MASDTPWSDDLDTILHGVVAEHTKAYKEKVELYEQALGEEISFVVKMKVEDVEQLFACAVHFADHTCPRGVDEILSFAFEVMNGAGAQVEEVLKRYGLNADDFEIGPEDEL